MTPTSSAIFYYPSPPVDSTLTPQQCLLTCGSIFLISLVMLAIYFKRHPQNMPQERREFITVAVSLPVIVTVCLAAITVLSACYTQQQERAPWRYNSVKNREEVTQLVEKTYGVKVVDHSYSDYPWEGFTVKLKDGRLRGACSIRGFNDAKNTASSLHLTPPPHTVPAYVLCNDESLTPTS